ncbi:hypothetical protein WJX82_008316 [Trebouxia sp. C0006]
MARASALFVLSMLLVACSFEFATAHAAGTSATSHSRRLLTECSDAQTQASAVACDININDGTNYFICLSGDAAGGCRSQELGTFSSDCTSSCVIMS